ncbi:homeobox protein TGIF1-like [Sycon ciliatum]|uniref:homeobox protein TGIF1-like n=1 Tax=Sycon ciliatum TaxID=27933 RepID=UPI0031F66671
MKRVMAVPAHPVYSNAVVTASRGITSSSQASRQHLHLEFSPPTHLTLPRPSLSMDYYGRGYSSSGSVYSAMPGSLSPTSTPVTAATGKAMALPVQGGEVYPAAPVLQGFPGGGRVIASQQHQPVPVPDFYNNLMMTEIGTGNQLNTFPFHVTRILRDWLCRNLQHPYATLEEKEDLRRITGLSLHQINYWLTNARRRLVPRLLQHVNQDRVKRGLLPVTKSRCKNKCKWQRQRQSPDHLMPPQQTLSFTPAIQQSTIGGNSTPAQSVAMYSPPVSPERSVSSPVESRASPPIPGPGLINHGLNVAMPSGPFIISPANVVLLRPNNMRYAVPSSMSQSNMIRMRNPFQPIVPVPCPSDPPPLEKIRSV